MDEARRKLRSFLIGVVLTAVMLGIIYYFTDIYGTSEINEGTLVRSRDYSRVEMIGR